MAHLIAPARDVLYLGRGPDYPLALEGALKLKEISYIHAEGYASGEMKHGPIALIDEAVPVIVLAPSGPLFEKTVSNMQEVRARGGKIVLISDAEGHWPKRAKAASPRSKCPRSPADRAAGLCRAGAAAGLSRRLREGHRCRPAAQSGEVGDGGGWRLGNHRSTMDTEKKRGRLAAAARSSRKARPTGCGRSIPRAACAAVAALCLCAGRRGSDTREEIDGKPFIQLIAGPAWDTGQFPSSLHDLAERLKRRESFSNLLVRVTINGQQRWWELSGTPKLDENGISTASAASARM
jgi:hypothetical protein